MIRVSLRAALPAVLVALTTALPAVESVPWADWRVEVGPAYHRGAVVARGESSGSSRSEVDWDRTGRFSVLWSPMHTIRAYGSGLMMLEISRTRVVTPVTSIGDRIDSECFLASVHQGFAWGIADGTTMELTGVLGVGLARLNQGSLQGDAWEAGLRLGVGHNLQFARSHWGTPLVGAALLGGYSAARSQLKRPAENYRLEVVSRGVAPALVVGWLW